MKSNIIPETIGVFIALCGAAVAVIGWGFDVDLFKSFTQDYISMKISTALCFIASGLIIYSIARALKNKSGNSIALIVIITGVLLILACMGTFLFGAIFNTQTGLEYFLVIDRTISPETLFAGMPSAPTMICFILIALSGIYFLFRSNGRGFVFISAGLIVLILGGIGIGGYIINEPILRYRTEGFSNPMAIPTAILFFISGISLAMIGFVEKSFGMHEDAKGAFSTLQGKLVALVFVALIPALGLIMHMTVEQRKIQIKKTEEKCLAVSKTAVLNFEKLAEGSRFLLIALSKNPAVLTFDPQSAGAAFADIKKHLPLYANIFELNPNGDIFASAVPFKENVNSSDFLYFSEAAKTHAFSFGDYQIGRIVKRPVIVSAYPILDKNEKLLAVVACSLDLEKVNLELKELKAQQTGALVVLDMNRTILAYFPNPENKYTGKTFPDEGLLKSVLERGQLIKEMKGLDGVERIYAFVPVGASGGKIFVGYGISKNEAYKELDREFYHNLLLFALIFIISFAMALFIGKLAKKTDDEMKKPYYLLSSLANNSTDAIYIKDRNGCYLLFNNEAARFVGKKPEEVIGKDDYNIFPAVEAKSVIDRDRIVIASGKTSTYEEIVTTSKGVTTFLSTKGVIYDEKGRFLGLFGITRDITERKNVEETLLKKDILMSRMSKMAKVGGWEFETDTLKGVWTDEVARIHDLEPAMKTDAQIGLNFYHGDAREKMEIAIKEAIHSFKPYDLELEMTTAKGNNKWIRTIGEPVIKDGRVVKLTGTFQDITERKKAEEARAEVETRYWRLHESMTDCFVEVAMSGEIIDVNRSYLAMLGYTKEEVRKLRYQDITPAKWYEFEQKIVENQILPRGYSEVYEKEYIRKGGAVFPVELKTYLLRDTNGSPSSMWAIVRDITERKNAEEKIKQSERNLSEAERIGNTGSWDYDVASDTANWSENMFLIFDVDPKMPKELVSSQASNVG